MFPKAVLETCDALLDFAHNVPQRRHIGSAEVLRQHGKQGLESRLIGVDERGNIVGEKLFHIRDVLSCC